MDEEIMWKDELKKLLQDEWDWEDDETNYKRSVKLISKFIESLLKEQREICAELLSEGCDADGYHYCNYPEIKREAILNAPEPGVK